MFQLDGIDHVALAVRDVSRSIAWYSEVLGFEHRLPAMWGGVPAFIGKGTTAIALFPVGVDEPSKRKRGSITMLHLAFRATGEDFLLRSRIFAHAGSTSPFRTTRSRTRSTFAILMGTNSRSRRTTSAERNVRHLTVNFTFASFGWCSLQSAS
jgi:hypothetical protein